MATKLTHEIRREITIDGELFTVIITPDGLRLSRKRFRSGRRVSWETLWRDGSRDGDSHHAGHDQVPGTSPLV